MSENLLGVEIETEPPKTFVRGQTLEFLMELPHDVPSGYFEGSDATTTVTTALAAQLRQSEDASSAGFLANLNPAWEPGTGATKIRFKVESAITETWPLGPVEFDVVLTRTSTVIATGVATIKKFRSNPIQFVVTDGITA